MAKDYAQARSLYRKACDGGNLAGCCGTAHLYRHGYGVHKDTKRALRLYTETCEKGSKLACDNVKELEAGP